MRDIKRQGKTASIAYQGKVEGADELVDHRSSGDPLIVVLGGNSVPHAIDEALFEMEIGEVRTVKVPPDLGFGTYDPEAVEWFPRVMLPNGYQLQLDDIVPWTNPEDRKTLPGRVIEITQDMVRLDFNHPFAGKTIIYELELLDLK